MKTTHQIQFSCEGFNSVKTSGEYSAAFIFAQRYFDRIYGRGKHRVIKIDGPINGMPIGIPGVSYAFQAYAVPACMEVACEGQRAGTMLQLTIKRCSYAPDPLPEHACEVYKEDARRKAIVIRLYGMPIEEAEHLLKMEDEQELRELLRYTYDNTELYRSIQGAILSKVFSD